MITRWIDRLAALAVRLDAASGRGAYQAGVIARAWALMKFVLLAPLFPLGSSLVAWRAAVNHERAKRTMDGLGDELATITAGGAPQGTFARIERLDATEPVVITSDLHRCISGRLDFVGQQDNSALYVAMLEWYADAGFGLIENGDIEDYWMVGGSTWGALYDVLRLTGAAVVGRLGDPIRRATYRNHLERIIANNAPTYRVIRERFASAGRYHRTVGNHDDIYGDDRMAAVLSDLVGGVSVVDWIALDGPDGSEAIITHGHFADGWNAPGRATLGKLSSWVADIVRDIPGPPSPDDLPSPRSTRTLLSGRRSNSLLRVDATFGANSSYDSLDEELLFDAAGGANERAAWFLMGHTHFPVFEPLSHSGARWWRYVNSGNGLGAGMITAIEWAGGDGPREPRLVAWCWGDRDEWRDTLDGFEPVSRDGARPVYRVGLVPSADGRTLIADRSAAGLAAGLRRSASPVSTRPPAAP